jgi:carbamoyltransferase
LSSSKYILGINGLGVLPSACLFKNGELLSIVEEERFTRVKTSYGQMPFHAIQYCLQKEGITIEDVDSIAFSWDAHLYSYKMPLFLLKTFIFRMPKARLFASGGRGFKELTKYQAKNIRQALQQLFPKNSLPEILYISHHLSHAASSFYSSSFSEAYVLVLDGSGEMKSTSIWYGNHQSLQEVKSFNIPDSLGWFYQTITEYLGFQANNHEGKTMALAAYGKENPKVRAAFDKIIQSDKKGNYRFHPKYAFGGELQGTIFTKELEDLLGPARKANEEIQQIHKDIAFICQDVLETIVLELIDWIAQQPHFNGNLCIAGGVGLNCKLNGRIAEHHKVSSLYVPPFTADNGAALGAAIEVNKIKKIYKKNEIDHAYWGPSFSNKEILESILGSGLVFTFDENVLAKSTELLLNNKVIAWFQGPLEVGSRALGGRSILANPLHKNISQYINQNIKGREIWRPFAATILYDKCLDFFDKKHNSPFMAQAFKMKSAMAEKLPAIVHIDQTTRPQTLKRTQNELYYDLIKSFGDETGVYALLNTSFNVNEEPIVCSPKQAIHSFQKAGLDALIIGNYIILKQ